MIIRISFILFFLISTIGLFAQNKSGNQSDFLLCVENHYGTNNLLVNGRLYTPQNTRAKGFPYFKTKDWQPGIIFIDGVPHEEPNLKFNLATNQLILKKELKNGTRIKLILSEELVDSFTIQQHLFLPKTIAFDDPTISGYVELIHRGKFEYYREQRKVFDRVYSSTKPHGLFSNSSTKFYVKDERGLKKVTKESKFLDHFGFRKTQIKKYMNQQKINWKKASKEQLAQLMKFIDNAS